MRACIRRCGEHEPEVATLSLRLVLPGWPQWAWRQRDRAAILFGWYISAAVVGLFCWGTRVGLCVLAFAFLAHVVSAADALRQAVFPSFGRWVPMISATAGLGLGYGPLLGSLLVAAWPFESRQAGFRDGYLIDRWAYLRAEPAQGQWIYFHDPDAESQGVGRVLARGGQEIDWRAGRLLIDGQAVEAELPGLFREFQEFAMRVPVNHVLIEVAGPTPAANEPRVIHRLHILGRAWARHQPIWARRILP